MGQVSDTFQTWLCILCLSIVFLPNVSCGGAAGPSMGCSASQFHPMLIIGATMRWSPMLGLAVLLGMEVGLTECWLAQDREGRLAGAHESPT